MTPAELADELEEMRAEGFPSDNVAAIWLEDNGYEVLSALRRVEKLEAAISIETLRAILSQPTREEVEETIRENIGGLLVRETIEECAQAILALFNRTPPHD